jgi:hypothetical protein
MKFSTRLPASFFRLTSALALLSGASLSAPGQVACTDTNTVKYLQPPNLAGFDVLNSGPWVLADDFVCTNTGPISDIHIWGSWLSDEHGSITNFWIGIYDDVPASPNNPNSHPGNLLWQESFLPGQFSESIYSSSQEEFLDPGPTPPNILGTDTEAWYYCFYPTNPFTQTGTSSGPKVYWIAAYAQVAPVVGAPTPQYGWKTTSIVQNDISVHTPWIGGFPGTNTTWLTNYYQPPAGGPAVPLDLAFKLETPTNIPTFCEDSNDAIKYVQLPNLEGLDVWDSGPTVLADDFVCTATGPITDIHIWGSWLNDHVATNSTTFTLAIYDDVPAFGNTPFSHPGNLLWQETFIPGQYEENLFATGSEQFLDSSQTNVLGADTEAWYYCFYPTNPFTQIGNAAAPKIYWLAVYAQLPPGNDLFGWKTTSTVQNDTSVHESWPGAMPGTNFNWLPTVYQPPTGGQPVPLDLSFKLTMKTNCCPVSILDTTNGFTNEVVVTWDCGILQSATNVIGPYANVPGATSPYTNITISPSPPHVFYRTLCP